MNGNIAMSPDQPNSGDDTDHPARKLDPEQLIQVIADTMVDVPSPTTRTIRLKLEDVTPETVDPKTVDNNLTTLAKNKEICSFYDGDRYLWWLPRDEDEGGKVLLKDVLDDSIDYSDIDPDDVPIEIAEEIAVSRIPYYSPPSLWSELRDWSLRIVVLSFALLFLGLMEAITQNYGLPQNLISQLIQISGIIAFLLAIIYLVSQILHVLAMKGYIPKNPV